MSLLTSLQANVVLCGYGSYVLFFILYDEFTQLIDQEFVHETTNVVVQSDARVAIQYLIHAEAVNTVLFALCSAMGTLWTFIIARSGFPSQSSRPRLRLFWCKQARRCSVSSCSIATWRQPTLPRTSFLNGGQSWGGRLVDRLTHTVWDLREPTFWRSGDRGTSPKRERLLKSVDARSTSRFASFVLPKYQFVKCSKEME